jgi:hypothetical protein
MITSVSGESAASIFGAKDVGNYLQDNTIRPVMTGYELYNHG